MDNPFAWSVSRHDTFMSCRRRYFYAYYAAHDDPEVRRLKKLSALPMWAGSVVHETIEAVLRQHDRLPSPTEQEAIVRTAVHDRMLTDWRTSEAGSPGFRLFEHEYATPVEQEDKRIAVNTVMRSLRNWFHSDVVREVYGVGRSHWLTLEDLVSFRVEGVPVMLRMDLAFRDQQGRVVIVDWKTGRGEGRFSEVQLALYALYAAEQSWGAPDEISTELAYLALPRYVRRRIDQKKLDDTRAFLARSGQNMQALLSDPLTNQAEIAAFAMIDRPRQCRRCNFRRLCFPRGVESLPEDTGPGDRRSMAEGI